MTESSNSPSGAEYWQALANAETVEALAKPWLAIQSNWIKGFRRGAIVLMEGESQNFSVIARWPEKDSGSELLKSVAEQALKEGKGVVTRFPPAEGETTARFGLAYPLKETGDIIGVVTCEVEGSAEEYLRAIMRQLQWGRVWLEFFLYKDRNSEDIVKRKYRGLALEAFASVMDAPDSESGAQVVLSRFADELGCDRVSIGKDNKGTIQVRTISNAFRLGERQDLVRSLGEAMDEAADQHQTIVSVRKEKHASAPVIEAHKRHIKQADIGALVTVPVFRGEAAIGVMAFEWPVDKAPDPHIVALAESFGQLLVPLIEMRQQNENSLLHIAVGRCRRYLTSFFAEGHLRRKTGWISLVVVVLMMLFVEGDYRVTADARLEGAVQRAIVAGIDGYILSQQAKAGDRVKKGDIIARLDTKDLILEKLRRQAEKQQFVAEASEALAKHDRSAANIARAQIEQADAQVKLINEQLRRTTLLAPFDGLVVTGDLSQSVGAAVRRGDLLFEVAPLDAYRVIIFIDERDIADIKSGQLGTMITPARPDEDIHFIVERLTPLAEARDGTTVFRVEAKAFDLKDWMQPGLEGVVKVEVGRRNKMWIWTHRFTNWLRLQLWVWWA